MLTPGHPMTTQQAAFVMEQRMLFTEEGATKDSQTPCTPFNPSQVSDQFIWDGYRLGIEEQPTVVITSIPVPDHALLSDLGGESCDDYRILRPKEPPMSDKSDLPDDSYAQDTPLTWAFGDHPKTLLIAALLSERDSDINVQDMSRISGLSRDAVYTHLDHLLTHDIVVRTRKVGNSPMYQINMEHEAVRLICEVEEKLLDKWYENGEEGVSYT